MNLAHEVNKVNNRNSNYCSLVHSSNLFTTAAHLQQLEKLGQTKSLFWAILNTFIVLMKSELQMLFTKKLQGHSIENGPKLQMIPHAPSQIWIKLGEVILLNKISKSWKFQLKTYFFLWDILLKICNFTPKNNFFGEIQFSAKIALNLKSKLLEEL